jgi:hypothetical protein
MPSAQSSSPRSPNFAPPTTWTIRLLWQAGSPTRARKASAPGFANPANTILVAERDGAIAACGAFNTERKIILNYVSPPHRFAGVSKALLSAMEVALGPGEARLDSTLTARRFYLAAGWLEAGPPEPYRHVAGYPMRKLLA